MKNRAADETGAKNASIPAWQQSPEPTLKSSSSSASASPSWSSSSSNSTEPTGEVVPPDDRHILLEQARIFVEDSSVREAPLERKVAFLEKKGLQSEEIQKLLETDSPSSNGQQVHVKPIHDSLRSEPSSEGPSAILSKSSFSSHPPSSQPASPTKQPNRDIPPIITYPEFLLRPSQPPPLVSLERLAYTVYTLAGISALTFGASKYLIQPMIESLTSSRHELASTALENLENLNKKLQGNVSHIPAMPDNVVLKHRERIQDAAANGEDDDDNTSTIDSDPTELFHRDIATQTSPRLLSMQSHSTTSSSATTSTTSHPPPTTDILTTQTNHLKSLTHTLSALIPSPTAQTTLLQSIQTTQTYLDKLQYRMPPYNHYDILHRFPATGTTTTTNMTKTAGETTRSKAKEEEPDEATRFRQEIRSLKGALLSGRNFPSGKPATALPARLGGGVLNSRS